MPPIKSLKNLPLSTGFLIIVMKSCIIILVIMPASPEGHCGAGLTIGLQLYAHQIEGLEHPEALSLGVPILYAVGEVAVSAVACRRVGVAVRVGRAVGCPELACALLYVREAHDSIHHRHLEFIYLPCLLEALCESLTRYSANAPCCVHDVS